MRMASSLLLMVLLFEVLLGANAPPCNVLKPQDEVQESVEQLILNLYSVNNSPRPGLCNSLVVLANQSPEHRAEVIRRLIDVLQDASTIVEGGLYQAWYDAAHILGALRATEALDVLIKYLDFSDGVMRFAVSRRPAVHALIQIGEPAVPKLIEALLNGEREIRRNAAEALGFIGGRQAREGLLRALITENDEGITREINRALSNIARTRRRKS